MRARSFVSSTLQSIAILAVLTATAHAQSRRPLESATVFEATPYVGYMMGSGPGTSQRDSQHIAIRRARSRSTRLKSSVA